VTSPTAPESSPAQSARTREDLKEFKNRLAEASHATDVHQLLLEGEDLLVHVCGQQRYASLRQEADSVLDEYKTLLAQGKFRHQVVYGLFPRPPVVDKAKEDFYQSVQNLKQRVAGIEFRG